MAEIAETTALAPSTVHRLLSTLESTRFLSVDSDTGRWWIGVAGFEVGNAFVRARDYVVQLRPLMVQLSERMGETVNLAILSERAALFVAQVESTQLMRMVAPLGSRVPLHASGAGKALMAGLPVEERLRLLSALQYSPLTTHTLLSPDQLAQAIERVIESGCAYDCEEQVMGMHCVASPVFNEYGHPLATISVSGPRERLLDDALMACGEIVRQMAAQATAVLGGQPPAHWSAYG